MYKAACDNDYTDYDDLKTQLKNFKRVRKIPLKSWKSQWKMDEKWIHVYTETDLLKYLVNNNFQNDPDYNVDTMDTIDTIDVSGITLSNLSFKVKFIGIKSFRQLGAYEIDGRAYVSLMVFQVKSSKDKPIRVMVVVNGKREILQVNTLRNLCFAIPGILRRHVALTMLTDRDKLYRMDSRPRGICFVINNRDFEDANGNTYLPARRGTEVDAQNLNNLFQNFGMDVILKTNLTDCDIIQETKKLSLMDHTEYDLFVCCVLSHGRNGSVMGVNNQEVPILEITSTFRNRGCPTLAEKPKLFFIQACQGSRPQRGVVQSDVCVDEEFVKVLPDGSDFLIACSSEPGYESFRHSQGGSYFVNSLVKHLTASANQSLIDILTSVCSDVSDETFHHCYKQVPWFTSTLTKTLIFNQCGHYANT